MLRHMRRATTYTQYKPDYVRRVWLRLNIFRRSCLCLLLAQGLSCILDNEIRCKIKCINFEFNNKPCDKLKSATYTDTCSRSNVYGANNRTRCG